MIHVVAVVTTKPGRRQEVLDLVRVNTPLVRVEQGCLEYNPLVDDETSQAKFGADTFVVVEKWADDRALAAHRAAPHMLAYVTKTKDLLANRSIHVLHSILTE
jgi:quinol monooxygenase YgiN